jgi:hypothetical protein
MFTSGAYPRLFHIQETLFVECEKDEKRMIKLKQKQQYEAVEYIIFLVNSVLKWYS